MLTPRSHQIDGAVFLSGETAKLLGDDPRVGKTGAAIIAADLELSRTILIVTTASGRAVWKRAFAQWSSMPRTVEIAGTGWHKRADVVIVSWSGITNAKIRAGLLAHKWDRLILDESHYAKSITAQRTKSALGDFLHDGAIMHGALSLVGKADGKVWYLTGTPIPHAPNDLYPMLRTSSPERLKADPARDWPDVTKYADFLRRYCHVRMKAISRFNKIPVVVGGKNLGELKERIGDFILRRTQSDVGIVEPIYDLMPLTVTDRQRRETEANLDATAILAAADAGSTKELEMHLGPLRRLTGEIKAHAVVEAVKEEFDCGLDKIVLAYWHKDVGRILADGLSQFGAVMIDGATSADMRGKIEQQFLKAPKTRVCLAQIAAAGEAIDLSAAAVLWFVETDFSPKAMRQMALRITNLEQKRQAFVRVCVLAGSIDEALQSRLMMLWTIIREVLGK